ncbi:Imm51 family immunity protein [Cryptosporangium sp. NPDC051539]|uniref:Imm51 family immunity protein n=1 Tax=Cryptosporangium sp. NPDC051539 TaxID=3363962 RepID=UPI00378D65F8
MSATRLIETTPGNFSLVLDAGSTPADAAVSDAGHEPNGYFWEGVAAFLVGTEAPGLKDRFAYDPEGGMFCAYGADREALEDLGMLLDEVAADPARMTEVLTSAEANGFEFDD